MYGNYPDLTHVRRILVIKTKHLGDVLLSSPLFSILKRALPAAKIDVVLYASTYEVLAGNPFIEDYLLVDQNAARVKQLSLLLKVFKKSYDLVIDLTRGDRGALLSLLSRASIRVGFHTDQRRRVYTHLVLPCRTARHEVERQLDALRVLGVFPSVEERQLLFSIPEELSLSHLQLPTSYVVIHPLSRWRFKACPLHLAASLVDALGKPVVLSGSAQERESLERIAALCKTKPKIATGLTIKELGLLLQKSDGLISVDSFPMHLASALKIPLVALFGPSSEQEFGPWMHPHSEVVSTELSCRPCKNDGCGGSKVSDCLERLSLQTVLDAANRTGVIHK